MSVDKHKEIYDNIKNLARDYKIDVLIPQARPMNTKILPNLFNSKLESMMDNMFAITINKSPNTGNPIIIKNRSSCEITEYIKSNDKVGLANYLDKLSKEEEKINLEESIYYYRLVNNYTHVLTNTYEDKQSFFNILENSQLFKKVITNKDTFFIKVAFNAEDYNFLREKVQLHNIIAYENIQNLLKDENNNTILKELLKESTFVDYLENNLKLKLFIGQEILNFNNKDALKIILNSINMHKTIDFTELYQKYTMNDESVIKDSLQFKWFNTTIKNIILYSNYDFTKEDAQLEVLNEENQQLINKKVLNSKLHQSLVAKDKEKLKLKKI